jgi:hypothetical protein
MENFEKMDKKTEGETPRVEQAWVVPEKQEAIAANRARIEKKDIERDFSAIFGKLIRAEAAIDKLQDSDLNNKLKYTDFINPLKETIQLAKTLGNKKFSTKFSHAPEFISQVQTLQKGLENFQKNAMGNGFASMNAFKEDFTNQISVAQEISKIIPDMSVEDDLVKTS